jgi:amino acid permease
LAVHISFTPALHDDDMADFLAVLGIVAFAAVMLGLIWALDRRMTDVQGILLALSIIVFIYLGVAMFKPEWF